MSSFALETTGGHGASTASVYFLFNEQLRDSGLPADVLVDELKKDIYLCASPGHYRESDYSPHAAQRAVEDELAFIEAGWEIY